MFFLKKNLHEIVLNTTCKLLIEVSALDEKKKNYLDELTKFSLLRKNNLLTQDKHFTEKFNYDFTVISKSNFRGSPLSQYKNKPININFFHSDEQQKTFSSYLEQYGSSKENLGAILSRSLVNSFYRKVELEKVD